MGEDELRTYCETIGLNPSVMYCKDCGKLIKYQNADIHQQTKKGKGKEMKGVVHNGLSFLTTREYNGHTYRLCRCRECVEKKYEELKHVKFVYSMKAAKYCQYAFDVPDEDFKPYTKARQALTLEKMIERYGEDGDRRWREYLEKQAISNSYEYKSKKGMTLEEYDSYNKSRAVTLVNMIRKYGTEGKERYEAYLERQRHTTSLEYFLSKYEDGLERYQRFDDARCNQGGASTIADDCFDSIVRRLQLDTNAIHYHRLNGEHCVGCYKLDFYDETHNLVLEFNGDIWHGNPKIYKSGDFVRLPHNKTVLVDDLWHKDEIRKNEIQRRLGCGMHVIWESDWRHAPERVLAEIEALYKSINNL